MMIDFNKILRESEDKKFEAIASRKEVKANPYSCNFCPKNHHKYCEHEHCILDPEWIKGEMERTMLQNKLKEEEDYLKHGQGTVGYNRKEVYKNVLRLRKLIGRRDENDKREDKGY